MTKLQPKLILNFYFLILSPCVMSAQTSYYLDQTKTQVEILDTTHKVGLDQMTEIFTKDTINFPKHYFNDQYHLIDETSFLIFYLV